MSVAYRADIYTPTGIQLPSAQVIEGECVLSECNIGTLKLRLSASYPIANIQKDGRIILQRAVDAGSFSTVEDATWIIRHRRQALSGRERSIEVWAEHTNSLMRRRIVAYDAGTSQTSKTAAADDMIKAIVRENYTAPTDTTRTMSVLSVAADLGQAPSISKSFSRRNVLTVLQDICNDAAAQGTYLGFEVRTVGTSLTLLTYINQRGVDRTYGSGNYLRVSTTSGAIVESSLDEDWTDEATYMYVLGGGIEEDRTSGTAQNTAAEVSSYGRVEDTYQYNSTSDTTILNDIATGRLYAQRGRVRYEARGQDVRGFRYGIDYGWGDLLTINDYGQQFDVRVDPLRLSWGRSGEQVDPHFTYDNTGLAI